MPSDFDEIYRLYAGGVYRFLLRLSASAELAEELTAETFYRAVKNIGGFKGECQMSVWLCHIGKNLYFDYIKRSERKNISAEGFEFPDSENVEISYENKEQAVLIHKALHSLDEPYKEVFSLRVFSELSFKEIGGLFQRSDGWARTVFFRAKAKILDIINRGEI